MLVIPSMLVAGWLVSRRHVSPMAAGVISLLSGALPYLAGMLALHGNEVAERAGPWLATMLLGLLYGGIGCLAFCAYDVLSWNTCRRAQPSACAVP